MFNNCVFSSLKTYQKTVKSTINFNIIELINCTNKNGGADGS